MPDTGPDEHARIRNRAYHLWEEAGRPEGRHDEFWHQAEADMAMPDPAPPAPEGGGETSGGEAPAEKPPAKRPARRAATSPKPAAAKR